MIPPGRRSRRLWAGASFLAVVIVAAGLWTGGWGPLEDGQIERSGQVHIASVQNNHTERVDVVVFTVTDEGATVDGNASTVFPGAKEDFGLLDCRDGQFVADRLRILVSTDGEPGYEIERFVELEPDDCDQESRSLMELRVNGRSRLQFQRTSG